jgi:hypothetical protein
VASDGDCICLRLRWGSCQFARRHGDGMVKHRKRIGASIDILMCIRQIYPNTRDHEVKTVEVIV